VMIQFLFAVFKIFFVTFENVFIMCFNYDCLKSSFSGAVGFLESEYTFSNLSSRMFSAILPSNKFLGFLHSFSFWLISDVLEVTLSFLWLIKSDEGFLQLSFQLLNSSA
jgi:hypothetical protein